MTISNKVRTVAASWLLILGPLAAGPATAQTPAPPPMPLQSMQSIQTETVTADTAPHAGTGAKVGAALLNVVYVPGKAITCTAGTLVAGGFMLLTFGTAYREAVSFFNEGCGGSWVLTPEEVAEAAIAKKGQFEF